MSSTNVKSGWLYRQTSLLRKWKRQWFVLTADGYLRYFEAEHSTRAEGAILIVIECVGIRTGSELGNVRPPDGLSVEFLLSVDTTSGDKWILCGDSVDDMKAWQLSLEQARHVTLGRPVSAPPAGACIYQPVNTFSVVDDTTGRYTYGYPVQSVTYAYPGQIFYGSNPPTQIVHVPAGRTVVYHHDPYGYRRSRSGSNLGYGMLAGAALGTMMWTPLLWAPLLWC